MLCKTYHCIPKPFNELEQREYLFPPDDNSTFEMIKHKPEGYFQGGWKSESTRLNQIRFYNQVSNNETNLSTRWTSHLNIRSFSTSQENITFISVKL